MFDDSAPLVDIAKGGMTDADRGVDDMIGSISVPLHDLGKGISIAESYPVRNQKGQNVGFLEIQISIMDSAADSIPGMANNSSLHVNRVWE